MFGIEANGKEVMIRPEEFVINENDGVKGVIQKISFWGSFYEAEVLVEDVKIVVRMMKNEWKVGEEVLYYDDEIDFTSRKLRILFSSSVIWLSINTGKNFISFNKFVSLVYSFYE